MFLSYKDKLWFSTYTEEAAAFVSPDGRGRRAERTASKEQALAVHLNVLTVKFTLHFFTGNKSFRPDGRYRRHGRDRTNWADGVRQ